ncbi:hypothetical protein FHETE_812 [Fusarium heterosporum]|uniref:NAD(P)-binding domain-containing protein n=1 Tax=Fusarium heterosporum TaxID=42747 RepID=A0A8H5U1F1_FUSHE|nr:hypothetical protein FHETE_812 [Fusarium heterosporum]
MNPGKPTIACFGATGGCVAATLANALNAGHYCTAVARNPDKLYRRLLTEPNISTSLIDQYLTVHQGDIRDPVTIAKALISPTYANSVVDFIVSGVGSYPKFQWSITRPFPLQDETICEDTIKTIYTSLYSLSASGVTGTASAQKPLLVAMSTAGCGRNRGVPLPIYLQYHYLLGGPLADKQKMENIIMEDKGRHIRNFVIMRPLFLTDGDARGDGQLKVGWEWGILDGEDKVNEPGPEIGYMVSRRDIGKWAFDHVVAEGGWEGKCIYLA